MKKENLFCDYLTASMGFCGRYTGGGKCDKHRDLKELPKRIKSNRFRGNSNYQREELGFKSNKE